MAKVITFSKTFPAYHPKAGQPTYFIEKISEGLIYTDPYGTNFNPKIQPKYHTIRAGNRWKVGDKFSPRVWSDKPYNSKQVIIAPNIEIKKVWNIEIEMPIRKLSVTNEEGLWWQYDKGNAIQEIITNDGLLYEDFWEWFPKTFKGQIICWNENINY